MSISAWVMVGVCVVWFVLFFVFTAKDLKGESLKGSLAAEEKETDPFMFTGAKAREEARESYLRDMRVKKYFDEQGITPFLDLPGQKEPLP